MPGDLKLALRSLPKGPPGLDDTYDNAMERIKAQPLGFCKLALNILTWVIHARTPLSPQLLLEALTIQPGSKELDYDYRPDLGDIDSLCAGLVTIDKDSNVVRLVHYTTLEYFQRRSWFPRAHFKITEVCITYLSYDIYDTIQDCGSKLWSFPPFYTYAATQWPYHANICSYDEPLLFQFLHHSRKASLNVQALDSSPYIHMNEFDGKRLRISKYLKFSEDSSGVHLTAYFGLTCLMRKLIDNGQLADCMNVVGKTPLHYAAKNGHAETVKCLLKEYHVDPNMVDGNGSSVLNLAILSGHLPIVRSLLEAKRLDLNIEHLMECGVLVWTALQGYQEILETLLEDHRMSPVIRNNMLRATPIIASKTGHDLAVFIGLLFRNDMSSQIVDFD